MFLCTVHAIPGREGGRNGGMPSKVKNIEDVPGEQTVQRESWTGQQKGSNPLLTAMQRPIK